MAGYKLGCPIPFEVTAWENTRLFLSFHAVHAHMLFGSKTNNLTDIDVAKTTALSFWNEFFPELHLSHFPKQSTGKVFLPKIYLKFREEVFLMAFLIKAILISVKNQVGHPEIVNALLTSELPYKQDIAIFFSGGLILASSNSSVLNRLHVPHSLSHAIVLNDKLQQSFNCKGQADSLAFLLQGLFLSNFDFLKTANELLHHHIEPIDLIPSFPGLWLFPLHNGSQWWLAAHNSLELQRSIQFLNDHLSSIGEQRIRKNQILISDIDRDGIFRF